MVKLKQEPLEEVREYHKWTHEEQRRFIDAVRKHGRKWVKVAEAVGTRTPESVNKHAYRFEKSI